MSFLLCATLVSIGAGVAQAQDAPRDTTSARRLDAIISTAERSTTLLSTSTTAVTRLSATELARLPGATLADLLRLAPGMTLVDFDGLGFDPQLMVRGFYGGGEAEYVVVLIDGRPVNQVHTGLVAWDVLPSLAAVEAVEIVRGGASSLYGDAAIGGVINIITRSGTEPAAVRWRASGGSYETWRADARLVAPPGWKQLAVAGGLDRTGGFREHAERSAGRLQVGATLGKGPDARLRFTARSHWRDFDEPGALLESLAGENRRASDPIFRFDHTDDRLYGAAVEGVRRLSRGVRLSGWIGGERREIDAVRTLALAPGFGDTKAREATNGRAEGAVQLEIEDALLPWTDRLLLGLEASRGTLESRYFQLAGGTREEYESASGQRGALDTHGESDRTTAAVFAQYVAQPTSALRLTFGGRFDRLRDAFDPLVPGGQSSHATTHSAFSPRLGVNLRYHAGAASAGNVYVAGGRSFKAPTLDQLYDQRTTPVPFPPFTITTSNPELVPQRGWSLEAGMYHGVSLSPALQASASVAVYQMDMKDELDFDIESFRYVNIGRSRHRGVEAGLTLSGAAASVVASYTLQSAVARSGDHAGRQLKAIPRHSLTSGLTVRPRVAAQRIEASIFATHVRDIFVDDDNEIALPNHTRVDAQVAFGILGLELVVDARNLLDARYSSSAFLDPAGSGEMYLYPAAGRVVTLGARHGW